MSDPINPYPQQAPYGQGDAGYGPGYGPQGFPGYQASPFAVQRAQSNASTVRTLSFLSFLFGGLMLSGAMWIWSDKLIEEARLAGVPMPLMNELASARSAAKMCSIIHLVVLGVALVVLIVMVAVWGFLLASISS
ncbi:hypothetical protein [uncultured Actinomyces sp.]|jgi:hypothetical protein|uniref:hypothetical protein n=1 Tax=uncultured Actinomyces sp. TaxID=249061 RepID=UPI0025F4A5E5|nr:hypothetical protein [uncultured Actinomyces sp.]